MKLNEKLKKDIISEAYTEYSLGHYDDAIMILADGQATEENYMDYAYILGLCYTKMQKYDEALVYLEQLVTGETDPRSRQCRMVLAYIYSITDRMKLAEYELKKLYNEDQKDPKIPASLGHTSWMQGNLEEGLYWYKKALEIDSENASALNGYGYLLACSGKELDKALTCCRKALDKAPSNPIYADSLGWVYFKMGKNEEASRYLYQASASLKNIEECKNHLIELEKALGRYL